MASSTKKRLGQYFSGYMVAELLVSLCSLVGSETVIDPMAGSGDMLRAAVKFGIPVCNLGGIEIDKDAACLCDHNLGIGTVTVGDAFSLAPYESLKYSSWDLVVTNPPYVRYQSMSHGMDDGIMLKNASETRNGLSQMVDALTNLSKEEKKGFQRVIRNYSGLSDLAVPSWLLCSALVKQGGTLAMVVPEAWMKRDYALPVKYLLLKFFDILFIVEDLNAAWFPDALIKTNLVVAKRSTMYDNPLLRTGEQYSHIKLSSTLKGKKSLVDNLLFDGQQGESAFASLVGSPVNVEGDGYELKRVFIEDFISGMAATQGFGKMMGKLEPQYVAPRTSSIPKEIRDAIDMPDFRFHAVDLAAWGIYIGQGLRTGANKFFYTELSGSESMFDTVRVDSDLGGETICVSGKYLVPAIRYQADAEGEYSIRKEMLRHRLLYLDEGFFNNDGTLRSDLDKPLSDYLLRAGEHRFLIDGKKVRFCDLSAVKPNTRKRIVDGQTVQRHWFMLPTLAKRHLPQLCLSRVNYKKPRCLAVEDGIVVDANFSTLWSGSQDNRLTYAVLALMNSSWVTAYLECIASIMGGGALKVEATHLRQIMVPKPSEALLTALFDLGKQLSDGEADNSNHILSKIDELVLNELTGHHSSDKRSNGLQALIQSKLNARNRQGGRK